MMPLSRSRLEFIATILQNVLNLGLLTLGLIWSFSREDGASGGRIIRA